MKEQRERLVNDTVEANLGKVEGTQSRFVDMGFVSPVLDEPTDYAGNFINAVKAGTEVITSSSKYKTKQIAEVADAAIAATTDWGIDSLEINEAIDPDTNLPFTPHQKQVESVRRWEKRKQDLASSEVSKEYAEAYIKQLSSSIVKSTSALFTLEAKNIRENDVSDWGQRFMEGKVPQETYRQATASLGMTVPEQSANLLKFGTKAVENATNSFYTKNDAFKEHITELAKQKEISGVFTEKHPKVAEIMSEEGKTYEEAKQIAIRLAVYEETIDENPSIELLKAVKNLKELHMQGDANTPLIGTLQTGEALNASKAITTALAAHTQYNAIDKYDPTRMSLDDMENKLTANSIDGKALSSATKARLTNTVQTVMDRDMANLWQGTATPENISRLNNMLSLNQGNKTLMNRYKEAFKITMDGLVASQEVDTMSTINYISDRVGADRGTNSAIWGLMNSMPRWQTAILAKELGASANDLEMLVASFDEQDYDDNGIIKLQGVSKNQASSMLLDADEIVREMPIMQGDYKRYLNLTATMMLIADRTGNVDKDLLKEQMLNASTHNVGTPLEDFGMTEGFRLPNSYVKSIALNAKAPSLVATATLMAVEVNNLETLKAQGFPVRTSHYYDDEGKVLERERIDWGQVDTRWVQVAPGRFDFRIQSGDVMKDFQISDDLIMDNIKAAKQRATVASRKRERDKSHNLTGTVSDAAKKRKIEYDLSMQVKKQNRAKLQEEAEAKGERGPDRTYGRVTESIIEWITGD